MQGPGHQKDRDQDAVSKLRTVHYIMMASMIAQIQARLFLAVLLKGRWNVPGMHSQKFSLSYEQGEEKGSDEDTVGVSF